MNPCRTIALPLLLAATVAGCASSYDRRVVTPSAARLEPGEAVLIATPRNGSYERREYSGSGAQTAAAVRSAFARHANRIAVSARCADVECLRLEAAGRYRYLVVPEILHWEDRNTEWSGIPDRIEIKVVVVDSVGGRDLASVILSGRSRWATFGGDHPQDLLPEPVRQFVDGLY